MVTGTKYTGSSHIFWKVAAVTSGLAAALFLLTSLSMYYWPSIPSEPRPAEGRIYPLNNHGHYTYMNLDEYRLSENAWLGFIGAFAVFAAVQHFQDPFRHKR